MSKALEKVNDRKILFKKTEDPKYKDKPITEEDVIERCSSRVKYNPYSLVSVVERLFTLKAMEKEREVSPHPLMVNDIYCSKIAPDTSSIKMFVEPNDWSSGLMYDFMDRLGEQGYSFFKTDIDAKEEGREVAWHMIRDSPTFGKYVKYSVGTISMRCIDDDNCCVEMEIANKRYDWNLADSIDYLAEKYGKKIIENGSGV